MKKLLTLLLVLAMMFSFAACGQDEPQQPADDQQQVEENNVEMQKMTADQLLEAMKAGEDLLILDVRKAADHEASHIPGAYGVDMDAAKEGDFEAGVTAMKAALTEITGSENGNGAKMVLVCYSGNRYAQASTNVLAEIGATMENVFTLEGGFNNWSEVNAEVVVGGEEVTDVEMKYMTADEVAAVLEDEAYLILDVRKAADHEAAHIPGAFGIDMDAAKEGDTAAGVEALKAGLLEATGDVKGGDKKMVLVCYSGARYAQATTNCLNAIGANMENVFTLEGGFNGWSETKSDLIEK
ncbi:MAG: hypothetical protein IJ987_07210 [Firmicutes bacterium]|nr:hypothetical protein [Bacillota bacterium]